MKKVALMQPYLFPYIGYFQLISAVDLFIVYDDVQWRKGGWINRNRILESNEPSYITLPVKKDSVEKNINERYFVDSINIAKKDILDRIKSAYEGAPYFTQTFEIIQKILNYEEKNTAIFIFNSIKEICEYLEITTDIIMSSSLDMNTQLRSQERVLSINEAVGSEQYVNAIGGLDLYDKHTFLEHKITLAFLKSGAITYKQFGEDYTPNLSIIDVMMFNSPAQIKNMIGMYELV